jgi:2-dehydro-3-deoxygalactonokinase
LIAVDWGTTNFRAFRLAGDGQIGDGQVLERRSSADGILAVRERGFAEVLRARVGDWIMDGEKQVLLSGMIGSRQGWVEAAYLPCPAGLDNIADAVMKVPFAEAEVFLVPGVIGEDSCGVPEVMRGEETEAIGMLDFCGGGGLVCLPGTHSKWIHLRDRKIVSFHTFMTGEVFAALRQCTILGRTMTQSAIVDEEAFLRGVARSADTEVLLHHLFGVRTLGLTNQLQEEASASYLSGLLIGHEVRAIARSGIHVHLAGNAQLSSSYRQAIEACGGSSTYADEDAAARGLAAIGRRLSWI